MRPELFNRLSPVAGVGDQTDVLLIGDERGDSFPDERVVVNRQHANWAGTGDHLRTATHWLPQSSFARTRIRGGPAVHHKQWRQGWSTRFRFRLHARSILSAYRPTLFPALAFPAAPQV